MENLQLKNFDSEGNIYKKQKVYYKTVNGSIINLTPLNGKKTCVKCLIEKDVSEYYNGGKGPCKPCKSIDSKQKYIQIYKKKKDEEKEDKPRLYYQNINGEKILLSVVNGRKTCIQCLIEKDVSEFYGVKKCGGCIKCRNEKKINKKNNEK